MAQEGFNRKIAEEAIGLIDQDTRRCKVGAILVLKNGSCIKANGLPTRLGVKFHAEASVISEARNSGLETRGSVLYTTLEPCIEEVRHFLDRPCYLLIKDAGISRVYYGVEDPNREIQGEGIRRLIGLGVSAETFPAELQSSIVKKMGKWYKEEAAILTVKDIRKSLLARRPNSLKWYTGFVVDGAIDAAPCPNLRRGWLPYEVKFKPKLREFNVPQYLKEAYELYFDVLHTESGFQKDNLKIMLAHIPKVFEDSFDPYGKNELILETRLSLYSKGLFYKDVVFADDRERRKLVSVIRKQSHVPLERRNRLISYILQNTTRFKNLTEAMVKNTLEGDAIQFPHELCLHLIVVSRDNKILLGKRSKQVAHAPGKWALSVEEQMKPEDINSKADMHDFAERAIFEELNLKRKQEVGKYCDLSKNFRVLSILMEQPRLNLSLCAIAHLDVEASEVGESIQGTPGTSQQEFRRTHWISCATAQDFAKWLTAWPQKYPPHWTSVYRAAMAYFHLFGRD